MMENCFTTLCWFLLYNNEISQEENPFPLEPPFPPPHTTALDQHRVPGWAPCVIHQLPTILPDVYICQCYFLHLSNPHQPLLCPQVHSLLGPSFSINVFMLSYVKKLLLFSH